MTTPLPPFERPSIFTLANKITIARIICIPIIVILLLENMMGYALWLIIAVVSTDFLDGLAARVKKEQTALGAFLDPMADKLLLTSVYLSLTFLKVIDIWVFVVIFSRDLLIVLGWGVLHILTGTSKISPRILGKVTTGFQMIVAVLFIAGVPEVYHNWLLGGIVLFSLASVIDYIIVGERRLGQWG